MNKTLFVIADRETVNFFRLLGAQGRVVDSEAQLPTVYKEIESQKTFIGGILIASRLTETQQKTLDKITNLGIPMITIPDQDSGKGSTSRLEQLLERAVGLKLNTLSNKESS